MNNTKKTLAIAAIISLSLALFILLERGVLKIDKNEAEVVSSPVGIASGETDLIMPEWAMELGFREPELALVKEKSSVTSIFKDQGFDSFVLVYQASSIEEAQEFARTLATEMNLTEKTEKASDSVLAQFDNIGEAEQVFAKIIRVESDSTVWLSAVNLYHLAG